eukprot:scaffold74335_cov26-Tisochrysis_lutea.AAC.1
MANRVRPEFQVLQSPDRDLAMRSMSCIANIARVEGELGLGAVGTEIAGNAWLGMNRAPRALAELGWGQARGMPLAPFPSSLLAPCLSPALTVTS